MRRLTFFEDYDEFLDRRPERRLRLAETQSHTYRPRGDDTIAQASLGLEHLSVSHLIDASEFFQKLDPTWVWRNLTSIALTSWTLGPDEHHAEISTLFKKAALAAMRMPRLKVMEVWNSEEGWACVFRYQVFGDRRPAALTWRANFNVHLEPDVVELWREVAETNAQSELSVNKELLDAVDISSNLGDAIHHIKLVNQVVHPVSLWQMRRESAIRARGRPVADPSTDDWGKRPDIILEAMTCADLVESSLLRINGSGIPEKANSCEPTLHETVCF